MQRYFNINYANTVIKAGQGFDNYNVSIKTIRGTTLQAKEKGIA
jgi:hypothetical protein